MEDAAVVEVTAGTRDRIVYATARLLERHGYEGAGMKRIAESADAALGSVYHFFPGGKADLAAEAIRLSDREFADLLQSALDGERDPAKAVAACMRAVAEHLRASDWGGSCMFTGAALGTVEAVPQVHRAIADAIERWQEIVADKLRGAGMRTAEARDLACTTIATMEGASLASQIARDDRPLRVAGKHLTRLIASYR